MCAIDKAKEHSYIHGACLARLRFRFGFDGPGTTSSRGSHLLLPKHCRIRLIHNLLSKSGRARAAGVAVSERAMAESSGASHNVLLGELSGRDRADAVLARLEATYVNRVSVNNCTFLLRISSMLWQSMQCILSHSVSVHVDDFMHCWQTVAQAWPPRG